MAIFDHPTPGLIALMGSGETAPAGRKVMGTVLAALTEPRTVAVLDSPAGFQPNCQLVAEKVASFIRASLGEYRPRLQVISTRHSALATPSGDATLQAIATSKFLFAGPGSPTYMIRELEGSPYWEAVRTAHRNGAAICLASAATVAAGAYSLPVYEIFKVGMEPFWQTGLDLLGPYDLHLAVIPHWNNQEGGVELDTSFCFMGRERFATLYEQLPENIVVLGIDEHTGCILDFAANKVRVAGTGSVHIIRAKQDIVFQNGTDFSLNLLRANDDTPTSGQELPEFLIPPIPPLAEDPPEETSSSIPTTLIDEILTIRAELRTAKQWSLADRVRTALSDAGIIVEDTPQGARWHMASADES
jgi:cyanophycinase-like exopeptidase